MIILFFHFLGPYAAYLYSALFIIFGTVHRRLMTQSKQTYAEQLRRHLREHKQLLISPVILALSSLPRLIIFIISGCVDVSGHSWLYLSEYFISFIPSVLGFTVFGRGLSRFKNGYKGW